MMILFVIGLLGAGAITIGAMMVGVVVGCHVPRRNGAVPLHTDAADAASDQSVAIRIEIADLRARMKRLEAIAAGVDL